MPNKMTVEGIAEEREQRKKANAFFASPEGYEKCIDFLLAELAKRDKALDVIEAFVEDGVPDSIKTNFDEGVYTLEIMNQALKLAGRLE